MDQEKSKRKTCKFLQMDESLIPDYYYEDGEGQPERHLDILAFRDSYAEWRY
jgi:hypothetical protein